MPEKRSAAATGAVIGAVALAVAIVFFHGHFHDDKTLTGASVSPGNIVGSDGRPDGDSAVTVLSDGTARSASHVSTLKTFAASASDQVAAGHAADDLALADAGMGKYLEAISLWKQAVRLDGADAAVYRADRARAFAQAPPEPGSPLHIVPAAVRPASNGDEFLMLHLGGTPLYNVSSVVYTKIPAHVGADGGPEPPVTTHTDVFPPDSYRFLHVSPTASGTALGPGTVVLFVVTLSRMPAGLTDGSVSVGYTLMRGRDKALQWKPLWNASTDGHRRSRTGRAGKLSLRAEIPPDERPDLHGPLGAADRRPTL